MDAEERIERWDSKLDELIEESAETVRSWDIDTYNDHSKCLYYAYFYSCYANVWCLCQRNNLFLHHYILWENNFVEFVAIYPVFA